MSSQAILGMPSEWHPLQYTNPGHVKLKVLHCVLFMFFNRAQRVLRMSSTVVDSLDMAGTAVLPLCVSCALHVACLCPGLVSARRVGRIPVLYALLHVMILHALAILIVTTALHRYATTASFLSVLLASHMCISVRPCSADLVPAQTIFYSHIMQSVAYILPVLCWMLLPILRVHELEAIALLYVPEAVCFTFAYTLQFTTLVLHIAVTSMCAVMRVGHYDRGEKHD
jgi:hypothetical protein